MKYLICAGPKTQLIINKLQPQISNENQLIGCDLASKIEETLKINEGISKILILQPAIDRNVEDIILNIPILAIADNLDENESNDNIQLINRDINQITLTFLKNIIDSFIEEDLKDVELEKEKNIHLEKVNKIKDYIENHNNSIVILLTGCANSYVSTLAYNISNYTSKNNFITSLIDMDTLFCSQMTNNKEGYDKILKTNNNLSLAINSEDFLDNSVLYKPNFLCLTNNILKESLKIDDKNVYNLQNIINKSKPIYNFIIIDCPFYQFINKDISYLLINGADKIIFNLPYDNKHLLQFLKITTLFNDITKEALFKKLNIIKINGKSNDLLNTGKNNLEAIDEYLAQNNIIYDDIIHYSQIPIIDELKRLQNSEEYLNNEYLYEDKYIEDLILKIIETERGNEIAQSSEKM